MSNPSLLDVLGQPHETVAVRPIVTVLESADGTLTVEPTFRDAAVWTITVTESVEEVPSFLIGFKRSQTLNVEIRDIAAAMTDACSFILALGRCDTIASAREAALACGFICIGGLQ